MPKKFKGENSKAVEARARKAAQKLEEHEKKERAAQDEYWKDEDKHVVRKQQRKDEKEQKRLEALQKKQEKQKLFEEEMSSIKAGKDAAARVTRAEIQLQRERQQVADATERKKEAIPYDERPLEENVNRLIPEGDSARSIEDAISVLSVKEPEVERHPEKRVKAAYQEYENHNLPLLKAAHPNLRLSQLKQMLKKDWMKSPDNPMNQRAAAYNAKR